MKNIAVLGARGFIGSNTVKYLKKNPNYNVIPVTRANYDLLDALVMRDFLRDEKIDVVIHCANQGGTRKNQGNFNDVIGNNLKMFFNVERNLTDGMKFINFGSGAQYDKNRDLIKVSEEEFDQFIPEDAYGYSKYVMSKYLRERNNSKTECYLYNLVIFGMFGIGEDYTFRFISNAIVKNLMKLPIIINQDVVFDYLYIDDYFQVLDFLIDKNCDSVEFNVTPTESISLSQIARCINEISDYKSEVQIRNEGMNFQYTGNNARLMSIMGNQLQFTPYKQAIQEMYEYYAKNIDNLDLKAIKEDGLLQYCKTNK